MTTLQPKVQHKRAYLLPIETRPNELGEHTILRGMFFHAHNDKEAENIALEHKQYSKLADGMKTEKLVGLPLDSPLHKLNDDITDYFTRRKPGPYVLFSLPDPLESIEKKPMSSIPPTWTQIENSKARKREGKEPFEKFAERDLKQQDEISALKNEVAKQKELFRIFKQTEGQIVVLDKARRYKIDDTHVGHVLETRVTEPGKGKTFGTPVSIFVRKDDLHEVPNSRKDKEKPIIQLPENSLKITARSPAEERRQITEYLGALEKKGTAKD